MPNQIDYDQNIEVVVNSSTFGTGLVYADSQNTVTAVSTDGINFVAVSATTDANGGVTLDGSFLSFDVMSNGNVTLMPIPNNQTVIDEIYANEQSGSQNGPPTDKFYYQLTDADGTTVTNSVSYQLDDIAIGINTDPNNGGTADYFAPEVVQPNTPTAIPGLSVHKSLATGQTSDANYVLNVKVSSDGSVLTIDPSGGGVPSDGTITEGADGSVSVVGTVSQINSDLERLTYTSSNPGSHTIDLAPTDDGLTTYTTVGLITVACYAAGTLVETDKGDVPVERLAVGDRLLTAAGAHRSIKWLGTRSYAGRFANANPDVLPICFKAGSLGDKVPRRDLWVSPKHAMFLDGVLIPAEHLVNGVSIIKAERVDLVEYVHIELDSHDVIIAEGALSETFVDDDSRGMFHNAQSFGVLYPDAECVEVRYCAPRVEDGFMLEAVRHRLRSIAHLEVASPPGLGTLRGSVERIEGGCVFGWAQSTGYPDAPVCVDVLVDGAVVARGLADRLRSDLRQAGIGDGSHAFEIRLPDTVSNLDRRTITVSRSADGTLLPSLKARLMASPALDAA